MGEDDEGVGEEPEVVSLQKTTFVAMYVRKTMINRAAYDIADPRIMPISLTTR